MARKVFISILGTGLYGKCKYGNSETQETRFVQTATLEWIGAKNWANEDAALIFLTTEAKKTSWEKYERRDKTTGEIIASDKGLKECLAEMSLPFLPQGIDIEDGKNDEEMWKIFITIFGQLKDEDWLYIDSTHGYRYLPMLLLVLSNYARFLKKDIVIKHISYGNYEARKDDVAPFVDLLPIVALQDWTNAANEFINFGNADRLDELTNKNIKPILIETQGQDIQASNLKKLSKNISELSWNIKTNRGKKIIEGRPAAEINKLLADLQQNIITPLNPVLEKIKTSVVDFQNENDVRNMLSAVNWCIDKNLIQEGFTLLQEGIISLFLLDDYDNEKKRNFVSGYLSQYKSGKFESTRFNLQITEIIELEKLLNSNEKIADWADIFSQIANIRNDINHAGIRENPIQATAFKSKLKDLYQKTIAI